MGTIDMSQVAGIKAVDAEGNELGVVSMNELTESISEQVLQTIAMRNQATTLEQPALMSAASTLAAGNDEYENELPEQTDLKWARALDASGNPILISKESLASVVGGLLPLADGNHNGLASKFQAVKQYRLGANSSVEFKLEKYGMYILTSETLAGVSMLFQKAYSSKDLRILLDPNNVNSNYFKVEQINDGDTVKVSNLSSSIDCTFSINRL